MDLLCVVPSVVRVILILGLVSPECSTCCSQIITNTGAIPKTPDLGRWESFKGGGKFVYYVVSKIDFG